MFVLEPWIILKKRLEKQEQTFHNVLISKGYIWIDGGLTYERL